MSAEDIYTYEKKILIRSEQVDMTRRLRISELFRLMEEASIAHTEEIGCTREKTLDRGLLWVITRQQAQIEELPKYDEEIIIRSWQGDMMHVFFPRFYEIERAGKIIVRGQALWILIDEEEREMIMPEEYGIEIPGRPGSDDMMLPPVVMPKGFTHSGAGTNAAEPGNGADKGAGIFVAENLVTRFSQVDINGHMNNTRYFDIIDDAMYSFCTGGAEAAGWSEHGTMAAKTAGLSEHGTVAAKTAGLSEHGPMAVRRVPRVIRANYLSELRAGDRFTLTGYREENGAVFYEGADGDKIKFRIAYEF